MTLSDIKTATRINIRDRIVSPATEGRLILETELLSISNSSVRQILPMLVSAGVAEMLGIVYQETIADSTSATDFPFTTIGIDPYIVTGVWVSADTSGSVFYPCRRLKSEDFIKQSTYSVGSLTEPVYTILSTGGTTSGSVIFRFDPALPACTGGIKVYSVAQPVDMSGSTDKPSLPASLHHVIPIYNAFLIFRTLGDEATAGAFMQMFVSELSALTGGKFKMSKEV